MYKALKKNVLDQREKSQPTGGPQPAYEPSVKRPRTRRSEYAHVSNNNQAMNGTAIDPLPELIVPEKTGTSQTSHDHHNANRFHPTQRGIALTRQQTSSELAAAARATMMPPPTSTHYRRNPVTLGAKSKVDFTNRHAAGLQTRHTTSAHNPIHYQPHATLSHGHGQPSRHGFSLRHTSQNSQQYCNRAQSPYFQPHRRVP